MFLLLSREGASGNQTHSAEKHRETERHSLLLHPSCQCTDCGGTISCLMQGYLSCKCPWLVSVEFGTTLVLTVSITTASLTETLPSCLGWWLMDGLKQWFPTSLVRLIWSMYRDKPGCGVTGGSWSVKSPLIYPITHIHGQTTRFFLCRDLTAGA